MPITTCEKKVAAELTANCINPIVEGKEKHGYLHNRSDIDIEATLATKIAGSNNLYASLVRKVGTKGYLMTNVLDEDVEKVDGANVNRWKHVITGTLLDDGDVPGSIIEALGRKDGAGFITVTENIYKDFGRSLSPGSSAFQIDGLETPLRSTGQSIKNTKSSADTAGGWSFGLQCEDNHPRTGWYSTSYTATKALFDALGTAAV
jgi:hypothetical protein